VARSKMKRGGGHYDSEFLRATSQIRISSQTKASELKGGDGGSGDGSSSSATGSSKSKQKGWQRSTDLGLERSEVWQRREGHVHHGM